MRCVKFTNITAMIVVSIGIHFIQIYVHAFIVAFIAMSNDGEREPSVRVELAHHYPLRM